jgi:hypothetical protein
MSNLPQQQPQQLSVEQLLIEVIKNPDFALGQVLQIFDTEIKRLREANTVLEERLSDLEAWKKVSEKETKKK